MIASTIPLLVLISLKSTHFKSQAWARMMHFLEFLHANLTPHSNSSFVCKYPLLLTPCSFLLSIMPSSSTSSHNVHSTLFSSISTMTSLSLCSKASEEGKMPSASISLRNASASRFMTLIGRFSPTRGSSGRIIRPDAQKLGVQPVGVRTGHAELMSCCRFCSKVILVENDSRVLPCSGNYLE